MINAVGQFCRLAQVDVCARCIKTGGAHDASKLTALTPAAHRTLFADLLDRFTHVVTPSDDAAIYLHRGFPGLTLEVVPHPVPHQFTPASMRHQAEPEIVLFGALGPHKGSTKLLEIARLAVLEYPDMRFRLIGFTDIDEALLEVGNVEITGAYTPRELPRLVAACKGRFALFLSEWPETFSYTLSEALQYSFTPVVPDLGAPAERVRALGIGEIYPFPFSAASVLAQLAMLLEDEPAEPRVDADVFTVPVNDTRRTREILSGAG